MSSYTTVQVRRRMLHIPNVPEAITPRQYRRIAGWLRMPGDVQVWTAIAVGLLADGLGWWGRGLLKKPGIDGISMVELARELSALAPPAMEDNVAKLDHPPVEFRPWIPGFRYRLRWYALPEPTLGDITLEEWTWISLYLDLAHKDKDNAEAHLNGLCAVMCRPLKPIWQRKSQRYDGYPRRRLNANLIDAQAKRFSKLPNWARMAALDYAEKAALFLRRAYPDMFSSTGGDGASFGWPGMALSLAEAGTFGTEPEVMQTNIHKVCLYGVKRMRDQQAMEDRLEKIREK